MAVQISAKLDSGFSDPIGMLKDCHQRIKSFLGILSVVVGRAHGRNLTSEERSAIQAAIQYFRVGGKRHTADEEESLFPRLRASDMDIEEIDRLENDHREADDLHDSVEQLYSQWIEDSKLGPEDTQRLISETGRLSQVYAGHIRIEEDVVFARAEKLLDRHTIVEIGSEFRLRRQPFTTLCDR
jgi:hemerythrin-like domain-containing protein